MKGSRLRFQNKIYLDRSWEREGLGNAEMFL